MPHRATRVLTLLLATAGACLAATTAGAQSAPSTGRYLNWPNRPVSTTPADMTAAQTRARDAMTAAADTTAAQPRAWNALIPRRVAPSQAPYRPALQTPVADVAVSRGLTPASAWLGPRVTPAYAPGSPDPIGDATRMAAADLPPPPPPPVERPAPAPAPIERAAADSMAPRRDAPVFNLQRPAQAPPPQQAQPVAADQVAADPAPSDPMAPRRDARIFQMQQGQTEGREQAALTAANQPVSAGEASVQSGQSGARYYSVHRDAGHRPDPTALPDPVYFDSVTLDLAEPPADETPVRDAQGRRRVVPNADPSLP